MLTTKWDASYKTQFYHTQNHECQRKSVFSSQHYLKYYLSFAIKITLVFKYYKSIRNLICFIRIVDSMYPILYN